MAEVPVDEIPATEKDELLCAYSAMILKDSNLDITEENLNALIKASGSKIEPFFPSLFAKLCKGKDVESMLKFGGGGGTGPAPASAGNAGDAGAPAAAKEEKKVEEEEEEEDMEFDLFG